MNYIPGFSNYLQAAVPRYARGGRAQFDEPMMYDVDRFEDLYQYAEPVYNEPVYDVPYVDPYMSAEPMYNASVYNEPVYNEPYVNPYQYEEPVYNEPVYNAPVYNEPYVDPYMSAEPMYPTPSYNEPAYNEPYVEPYQYAEPAYSEPVFTPAVAPMTQEAAPAEPQYTPAVQAVEAAAPYDLSALAGLDLSGLNNLYGMNFASDFGGGAMGGIYPDDPNTEYIAAPLSNKGNATGKSAGNTFIMTADQPVRLVDLNTNQVVFEGTGYDAAREATRLGQGMTDTMGRKASYDIQTADPSGVYTTVANEKKNKSTLGEIANVAGTVLPMAAMFIPGLQGLGAVAAGAGLGGAGAALKGDNILKGALMGGLTSAGGALLSKPLGAAANLTSGTARALGTGIGATAGGLATGQNLQNSLLGGVLSGGLSYVAPSIQEGLGIGQGAAPPTGGSAVSDPSVMANVIGSNIVSPSVSLGGAKAPAPAKPAELEPPVAIVSGSGSPFAAAFPIPASVLSGVMPSAAQQPTPEPDKMPQDETIKVTGSLQGATPSVDLNRGLSPEVLRAVTAPQPVAEPAAETPAEDIIKVTGERFGAVSPNVSIPTSDVRGPLSSVIDGVDTATGEIVAEGNRFRNPLSPNVVIPDGALSPEVLRAVNAPAEEPLIKVTGRQTTTPPVIMGVEAPLPDMTQPAEADKKLTAKDIADYLRIAGLATSLLGGLGGGGKGGGSGGTIPAGMGGLSSVFSKQLPPSTLQGGAGGGALPASTLAAQGFRSPQDYYRYGYGPEQSFFEYATQGAPNTSRAYTGYEGTAAEDMFAPQPMRVATSPVALPQPITTPIPNNPAGPSMYAPAADDMRFARGGFAVEGAGDGRDDKIPALLSDGEYVIDAETVALLGNGSNKAGAKLLDSFRVKVRKQKGKKLARGKFSDNAKRPEQYLAGGPA
jgi:hypothetical protein